MFHLALYEPEIPPNTGNIIRLCANTGTRLHLIHPLGFRLEDRQLRRAGLDYHEYASIREHASYPQFIEAVGSSRLFAISTRGHIRYDRVSFREGDVFLFGPESRGLPGTVLESFPEGQVLHIPMREGSRSLNLGNAAAVVIYEAWRQNGFGS